MEDTLKQIQKCLIGRTLILTINPMKGYQAIVNRYEDGNGWVLEWKWTNNYNLDELLGEVLGWLRCEKSSPNSNQTRNT